MKCKFCQQECDRGDWDGVYEKTSTIYVCYRHPVPVKYYVEETYHKSGECSGPSCCPKQNWHATSIFLQHKGETYQINWYPERHSAIHDIPPTFRVDWNRPDGKGGNVIFELQYHPSDVKPENVMRKLSTWLTFS